MTGNNALDVFILGIIFGFGLFLCVDLLVQKVNKTEKDRVFKAAIETKL